MDEFLTSPIDGGNAHVHYGNLSVFVALIFEQQDLNLFEGSYSGLTFASDI